jgi:hypothetical protein
LRGAKKAGASLPSPLQLVFENRHRIRPVYELPAIELGLAPSVVSGKHFTPVRQHNLDEDHEGLAFFIRMPGHSDQIARLERIALER